MRYPSKKFDVFVAAESTFGTALTTDASYQQIEPVGDSLELSGTTEQIDLGLMRADMMHGANVQGIQSALAKLSLPLRGGTDTNAIDAISDLNPQYDALFGACFSATASSSSGLSIGGSSTLMPLDAGDATPDVGDIMAISYNNVVTPEVAQVQSVIAGTSFTLYATDALSGTPTADGVAHGGTNMTPVDEDYTSCSIVANSILIDDEAIVDTVAGCLGNVMIEGAVGTDPGAFWQIKFDMLADSKARADGAAPYITVAGGASAIPTQANPISVNGSCTYVDGEAIAISSFAFDAGLVFSENTSACATNGRGEWVLTERNPTVKLTVLDDPGLTFDPESYYNDGTTFALLQTMGTFPNSAAFSGRKCQITERTKSEVNGIMAWDLTMKLLRPTEVMKEWVFTIFGDQT